MSDHSDIEENIKQSRIDLNIKKKPPRQQTEAQKQNIQKALAARMKKIEERKQAASIDKKEPLEPPKTQPMEILEQEQDEPIVETKAAPPIPKTPSPKVEKAPDEVKQMKKRIKKIELEELVQERINNALDDYKEFNQQQKEIKRLKKLEQRLEEEKQKDPYRGIKFRTPDGITF